MRLSLSIGFNTDADVPVDKERTKWQKYLRLWFTVGIGKNWWSLDRKKKLK